MTYKIIIPNEFGLICTYPMCNEHADLYRTPEQEHEDSTETVILCKEHATIAGFCVGCGWFCGSLESFYVVSKFWGYCKECGDKIAPDVDVKDKYIPF